MNLKEIREKLRDLSGRYDLVTSAGTDQGADFFIRAGQKWLDRQLSFSGEFAELSVTLATNANSFTLSSVRAVKAVGIKTDENFKYLGKRRIGDMKRFSAVTSGVDSDEPRYYGIGIAREQVSNSSTVPSAEVLIHPPADEQYEVVIEGLFESQPLENDTDVSFWSEHYPSLLIEAALYRMEPFNRNSTGENDYLQSLNRQLEGIDFDRVEEQAAEVDQMDNLWRHVDE